jgi:very-short-patch-repair endonuclease
MSHTSVTKCRNLRKNQTDAEKKLWGILRNRQLAGIKFRRQFVVGRYILDFYSPEHKLAIEADGGQHYEDSGRSYDEARTKELAKSGIRLIRFSDLDILKNLEGVYEVIQKTIGNSKTTPSPLSSPPKGGEEIKLG